MTHALRAVSIQELSGLAEGRCWELDQCLDALDTLTPVRGHVQAVHRGNVLEVEGQASTIVTLCCDRCLQHFNHPLSFQTRELLWLEDGPQDAELDPCLLQADPDESGTLSDCLDPEGNFDPAHWTFEQLSLRLPLVNRCGPDCPGPASWGSSGGEGDPRWAALSALRTPPAPEP